MSTTGRTGLRVLALLGLLLLLTPAAAQAWRYPIPIGDPIEATNPYVVPIEGSFELAPATAADPDGGPPWRLGTFSARFTFVPPEAPDALCVVAGRLVDDRLGEIAGDGVFHPYALGAGAPYCALKPADGGVPVLAAITVRQSIRPDVPCVARAIPEEPSIPVCDPAIVRTIAWGVLGEGVLAARIERTGGGWDKVRVWPGGQVLTVESGVRERFALPEVGFRICGPNGRPDLLDYAPWAIVKGCSATMTILPRL
jgi:hypothetical protein